MIIQIGLDQKLTEANEGLFLDFSYRLPAYSQVIHRFKSMQGWGLGYLFILAFC